MLECIQKQYNTLWQFWKYRVHSSNPHFNTEPSSSPLFEWLENTHSMTRASWSPAKDTCQPHVSAIMLQPQIRIEGHALLTLHSYTFSPPQKPDSQKPERLAQTCATMCLLGSGPHGLPPTYAPAHSRDCCSCWSPPTSHHIMSNISHPADN
jgi:hypothetical protein